jgi:cell division protein FtsW (lipid II flippase)
MPWPLCGTAAVLVGLGWLGIARCEELGGGGHALRQQVVWSALALAAMGAATLPGCRTLCRLSYPAFLASLVLLAAAYGFPAVNGARRWIRFGPLGLQPSELAKVAYVLALARYLMYRDNQRTLRGLLLPLGLTLVPVILVLREPDLGTALVFLPVFLLIVATAGARRRDLVKLLLAAALAVPLVWSQMSRQQKSRIVSLLEQPGPGEPVTADTFQLHRAKQVLVLGGAWGSLLGHDGVDDPGVYQLPEARTDFILCVLGERLGLPGIVLVFTLYAVLVGQGLRIALAAREPFGRLAAAGLSGLVAVQVLVNTAMAVGLLPVVGLSLPLVSYGGSGLVASGLILGLLVNISLRPGYDLAGEPFRYAVPAAEAE